MCYVHLLFMCLHDYEERYMVQFKLKLNKMQNWTLMHSKFFNTNEIVRKQNERKRESLPSRLKPNLLSLSIIIRNHLCFQIFTN